MILVLRAKEGRCPEGALCVRIAEAIPVGPVHVPDGDYLVVMSSLIPKFVDVSSISRRFRRVICVGPETARAVGECIVPRRYDSRGVAEMLRALAPGRAVVLRSAKGNDILKRLVDSVVEVPVYDLAPDPIGLERAREVVEAAEAVVLSSGFVAEIAHRAGLLAGKMLVAIGPATSEVLARAGLRHYTSPTSTVEAAVEYAKSLLRPKP
ncbi:MAG: uroporphyrinogen-III synthase [Thermoproteus sp.]|nr:uroporphyrinogen-III synthase [Thermoproteus sp.]